MGSYTSSKGCCISIDKYAIFIYLVVILCYIINFTNNFSLGYAYKLVLFGILNRLFLVLSLWI